MDTTNKYVVGLRGGSVVVMRPVNVLSANDAMMLAAWLITIAQIADSKLPLISEYIAAVEST